MLEDQVAMVSPALATTPGWDDVTGLGTPTAALLSALAG
jgi:hypothetical protein